MPSTFCKLAIACIALVPFMLHAEHKIDQVINEGIQRTNEGAAAQHKINALNDQTKSLLSEYSVVTKLVDGLKTYNGLLSLQIENQHEEITALQTSMQQVTEMERQIVPLMSNMIESLDKFVGMDMPFLIEERTARIAKLRAILERSDVTNAEKFRKVIEAYEIEVDYGRTIEAYKGSLSLADNQSLEVDFLRFGRVALMYQTAGGSESGVWNPATRSWEALSDAVYRRQIGAGIAIARKQAAPDLLVIPIPVAKSDAP